MSSNEILASLDRVIAIAAITFSLSLAILLAGAVHLVRQYCLTDDAIDDAAKPFRVPRPWRAIAAWLKQRYLCVVWKAFSSSPLMKAFQHGVTVTIEANQPLLTQFKAKADDMELRLDALQRSRKDEVERAFALGFEAGKSGHIKVVPLRVRTRFLSMN